MDVRSLISAKLYSSPSVCLSVSRGTLHRDVGPLGLRWHSGLRHENVARLRCTLRTPKRSVFLVSKAKSEQQAANSKLQQAQFTKSELLY